MCALSPPVFCTSKMTVKESLEQPHKCKKINKKISRINLNIFKYFYIMNMPTITCRHRWNTGNGDPGISQEFLPKHGSISKEKYLQDPGIFSMCVLVCILVQKNIRVLKHYYCCRFSPTLNCYYQSNIIENMNMKMLHLVSSNYVSC